MPEWDGKTSLGDVGTLAASVAGTSDSTELIDGATYSRDFAIGTRGITFSANVGAGESVAEWSVSGNVTKVSDTEYIESGVTIGTYSVAADATNGISVVDDAGASVAISTNAGSYTATFSNGVTVSLDTAGNAVSYSYDGVDCDVTKNTITLDGVSYTYATSGSSGTLTVDASTLPVEEIGLASGTGVDVATYTANVAGYTLTYKLEGATGSLGTTAVLESVKDGETSIDISETEGGYSFKVGDMEYTVTDSVDESLNLSGTLTQAGSGTYTFRATTGSATAALSSGYTETVALSYDGSAWAAATDTATTALGDKLSLSVQTNAAGAPILIAKADHGLSESADAATVGGSGATEAGQKVVYSLGTGSVTVLVGDDGSMSLSDLTGGIESGTTANTITYAGSTYTLNYNSTSSEVTAVADTSTPTLGTLAAQSGGTSAAVLGTGVATFSITSETSAIDYTLTATYDTDKALSGATVVGSDGSSTELSNGAGTITVDGNTYNIAIDAATFENDTIDAGEIKVTGPLDLTIKDTSDDTSDNIEIVSNGGSKLLVYNYDGNHKIAFNLASDNTIAALSKAETLSAGSSTIAWDEVQALAYYTKDGGATWTFDKGTLDTSKRVYTPYAGTADLPTGKITLAYGSNAAGQTYALTPEKAQTFKATRTNALSIDQSKFKIAATNTFGSGDAAVWTFEAGSTYTLASTTTLGTTAWTSASTQTNSAIKIAGAFNMSITAGIEGLDSDRTFTFSLGTLSRVGWTTAGASGSNDAATTLTMTSAMYGSTAVYGSDATIWEASLKIGDSEFHINNTDQTVTQALSISGFGTSYGIFGSDAISAVSGSAQIKFESTTDVAKLIYDSNGFGSDNGATDYTLAIESGDGLARVYFALGSGSDYGTNGATMSTAAVYESFTFTNDYSGVLQGASLNQDSMTALIDSFTKIATTFGTGATGVTPYASTISVVSSFGAMTSGSLAGNTTALGTSRFTLAYTGGTEKVNTGGSATSVSLYQATVGSNSYYLVDTQASDTTLSNKLWLFGTSGAFSTSAAGGVYIQTAGTAGEVSLSANGTSSAAKFGTAIFGSGADSVNATIVSSAVLPTVIQLGTNGKVTDVLSVYTNAGKAYQTGLTGSDLDNYVASRVSIDGSNYYAAEEGSIGNGAVTLSGITAPDGADLGSLYLNFTYNPSEAEDANTRGNVLQLTGVTTTEGGATSASLTVGDYTVALENGAGATVLNKITVSKGTDSIEYNVTFDGSTIGETGSTLAIAGVDIPVAVTAGEVTAPVAAQDVYIFSDTDLGVSIQVGTDMKISGIESLTGFSGEGLTTTDSGAAWTDTTKRIAYTAVFNDLGDADVLDASDTVVITGTSYDGTAQLTTATGAGAPTQDHYSATITLGTLGEITVTSVSSDIATTNTLTYTKSDGSTLSAEEIATAGYQVELRDKDETAFNGNEFFAYFTTAAYEDSATATAATVEGKVGAADATHDLVADSWTINGTALNGGSGVVGGSTYTLGSNDVFTVVTGTDGETTTFGSDDYKLELTRTITGSQIAGTAITIIESGTTSAVSLADIQVDGSSVLSTEDGQQIATIDGVKYVIKSASADNYTATADANDSSLNLTTATINIPTSYTFVAGTESHTVVVNAANEVREYSSSTNEVGEVVTSVTAVGNITYTLSYDNSTHVASIVSNISSYSTQHVLDSTPVSYITVAGVNISLDDFTDVESDDEDSEVTAQTYTTTISGVVYVFNYPGTGNEVTYTYSNAPVTYSFEVGDEENTLTSSNANADAFSNDATYTFSLNGTTYTTTGSNVISLLSDAGASTVTLTRVATGSTTIGTKASYSYLTPSGSQTTIAITNNQAVIDSLTTLTFLTGADGTTYTSVSSNNGTASLSGSKVSLSARNGVVATKNADGVWEVADGIDNVTNSTDEAIEFKTPDGDSGTLAPGASYNPSTNTLTNGGESVVKTSDGDIVTKDGVISDLPESGSVAYDEDGKLQITGANDDTKLNGSDLPVSQDDNFNATVENGKVTAVSGVSDGASVDLSNGDLEIGADAGANIGLSGDGKATINGDEVQVTGDENGYTVTTGADGSVESLTNLEPGANVTVPEGTEVNLNGNGNYTINDTPITVAGDADGYTTVTPTADGLSVTGLSGEDNSPAFLTTSSDSEVPVTVNGTAGEIGPNDSIKADSTGAVSPYSSDDKDADDTMAERGIDINDLDQVDTSSITPNADGAVDLSERSNPVYVRLDSDDSDTTLILPTVGGSYVQIDSDATGNYNLIGNSDKGDNFVNNSDAANVTMQGGAGADYYKTGGADDVIDVSNGGRDSIDALENGGIIENYDPTNADAPAILAPEQTQESFVDDILNGNPSFSDNGVNDLAITPDLDPDDDRTLARFVTGDGDSKLFGWTGADGGQLSSEGLDEPAILVGNTTGDHAASTIDGSASAYADTIIAGAGDLANAGDLDDIKLVDTSDDDTKEGAQFIANSNAGDITFTVDNFHGGFNRGAHGIRTGGFTGFVRTAMGNLALAFGSLTAILTGRSGSANFDERFDDEDATVTATNEPDYSDPGTGVLEVKALGLDGKSTVNTALISGDSTYQVGTAYSKNLAFIGEGDSSSVAPVNGSTVDFGNVTGDVVVDMGDALVNDGYSFTNIQAIKGGAGNTTLVGAIGGSNEFYAGTGNSSVYSADGADTIHGTASNGGTSATVFFGAGAGNDQVVDFAYGTDTLSDQIIMSDFAGVNMDGNNVQIAATNGDTLTLNNANAQAFKAKVGDDTHTVKMGTNNTYDKNVEMYGAFDGVLNVEGNDVVELFMNGKTDGKSIDGKYYFGVSTVDASANTASTKIAGADYEDNVLIGSATAANTLWGGFGGNDSLVGGDGVDHFLYTAGGGVDTVVANSGDVVELLDISLDDIDLGSSGLTSAGIYIKMKNGDNAVGITGSGLTNVGVKVGNTTYKVNSDGSWRTSN